MFDLKDKVVLLTGGSIGIGAKVTEYLLEENVKVVVNLDIADNTGIPLQNELNEKFGANKVKFIKCDVSDDAQLLAAFDSVLKEYEYIDVVVNNAGIMNDAKDRYKKELEVNVVALTTGTLKALEIMRKDEGGKGGVVMNMSSIAAFFQSPGLPVYGGSKSYVLQFSNSIGLPAYYDRTGVKVLTICFGATDTSLLSKQKVGSFDKVMEENLVTQINTVIPQKLESAAHGVVDAIKAGESGTTWLSTSDEPVRDVTDVIKKAYGILAELVVL